MSETHDIDIRVFWEDTDAAGIVYYANYLKFMERGRTEWLRARGLEQRRLAEETGVGFAVREVHLDYLSPARLDDLLTLSSRIVDVKGASITFEQTVRRDRTILVTGRVKCAAMDIESGRPRRIPKELAALV